MELTKEIEIALHARNAITLYLRTLIKDDENIQLDQLDIYATDAIKAAEKIIFEVDENGA